MAAPTVATGSLPALVVLAGVMGMMAAMPSSSFSNNLVLMPINRHLQGRSSLSSMNMMSTNTLPLQSNNINSSSSSDHDEDLTKHFSTLRSIGVDYGLARTGLAVTYGGYSPRPLAILADLDAAALSAAIVDRVLSERASHLVLGLPLHKNGTASYQGALTRSFGRGLLAEVRRRCGPAVQVALWDERYTSKEAVARIQGEAMARNRAIPSAADLGGLLDADAACIILEDYYKELGADAELVMFEGENATAALKECDDIYQQNLDRQERWRVEQTEQRERGRNARREMMDRVLEEERNVGAVEGDSSDSKRKKKKKKKKKKKR